MSDFCGWNGWECHRCRKSETPQRSDGAKSPFLESEQTTNKTMSVSGDDNVPQMKVNYFKDPVEFTQMEADTRGMTVSYGRNSLGIILDENNTKEISKLVKKHKTENPIRNNGMLYLKEKNITEKMKEEILFKGPMTVKVKFCATGVCENLDTDTKYLMFKILGLKKVSNNSSFLIQDDF